MTPVVLITLPFLMSVVVTPSPSGGCAPLPRQRRARWRSRRRPVVARCARSRLHQFAVGVGAAIAVERPPITDQLDLVHVEVAYDQLRLVRVGDVADGLNTISAPLRPSARQPSGKWRS